MLSLRQISKKNIISAKEAKFEGLPFGIIFNYTKQKIKYLTVLQEEKKYIDIKHIQINDNIMISNQDVIKNILEEKISFEVKIMQIETTKGITLSGKELGYLADIMQDENNQAYIIFSRARFFINQIQSISNDYIIINDTLKKRIASENKFKILMEKTILAAHKSSENSKNNNSIQIQKTIDVPYAFLLGKRATKNIYYANGKLLIHQGAIIDQEILALAKKYNKLIKLSLYSR